MIQFKEASRWYGEVIGVNDITCAIGPGITALLGQNGAGKSTILRMISGQLRPTTGSVEIFGMDPFANPDVFRRLGYCPEIDNFYEYMTGREFVVHMARLHGYSAQEARSRANSAVDRVGMSDRADRKLQGFSKGMRQRIKLAQAMVHDPDIILLDEPLNGLDPIGRREFMDLLGRLADDGKCVLVSSHILFEVEQLTRSIMLLHRGRLLATGDLRVVRELIDRFPHRVTVRTSEPRRLASHLASDDSVVSLTVMPDGEGLELQTRNPDQFYSRLTGLLLDEHIPIESFTSPDNNLESIFEYLVEA